MIIINIKFVLFDREYNIRLIRSVDWRIKGIAFYGCQNTRLQWVTSWVTLPVIYLQLFPFTANYYINFLYIACSVRINDCRCVFLGRIKFAPIRLFTRSSSLKICNKYTTPSLFLTSVWLIIYVRLKIYM